MYLNVHNKKCSNNLVFEYKNINKVKKIKYLGIIVDCHVQWNQLILDKTIYLLDVFRKLKNILHYNMNRILQ